MNKLTLLRLHTSSHLTSLHTRSPFSSSNKSLTSVNKPWLARQRRALISDVREIVCIIYIVSKRGLRQSTNKWTKWPSTPMYTHTHHTSDAGSLRPLATEYLRWARLWLFSRNAETEWTQLFVVAAARYYGKRKKNKRLLCGATRNITMCVNHLTMVPAVVNIVASKGKDTYTGFISEITCFKCRTLSVGVFFCFYRDVSVKKIAIKKWLARNIYFIADI